MPENGRESQIGKLFEEWTGDALNKQEREKIKVYTLFSNWTELNNKRIQNDDVWKKMWKKRWPRVGLCPAIDRYA